MWAIYLFAVVGLFLSLAYLVPAFMLYLFFRQHQESGAGWLAFTWPFFSLFLIGCEILQIKVEGGQEENREEYDNVVNFPL